MFYPPYDVYNRQNQKKSSLVAIHNIRDNHCMKQARDHDLFGCLLLANQIQGYFLVELCDLQVIIVINKNRIFLNILIRVTLLSLLLIIILFLYFKFKIYF